MTDSDEMLTRLSALVAYTWDSTHSSFYRDHCALYGVTDRPQIDSIESFKALPPIARGDLQTAGIFDRSFTPLGHSNEIRSTSGTTGSGPLYYARDVLYYDLSARIFKDGARRKLMFWNYNLSATYVEGDRLAGLQTVVIDPHQLERNVNLVELLPIDTLAGTPSILQMFGQLLEQVGQTGQILFLDLQGEPCSEYMRESLQALFPSASIYSGFAVGEIGQEIGMRFPQSECQDGNFYHVNSKRVFVEEVDGELVVSRLQVPTIFPLIRYKPGDHIELLEETDGSSGQSFRLLGRSNVDFVRIAGAELRHEAIATIVRRFTPDLMGSVVVEAREKAKVEIKLIAVTGELNQNDHEGVVERLKEALLCDLNVSATTKLGEVVAAGLFDEPVIELVNDLMTSNKQVGIKLVRD